ncbi:MAG: FAD-dependent monooxygenase [Sphingomonadaceae bacterium]|nr:FAD-dependent monooxygenase [Sphingomonadaceae bacterium]
MKRINCDVAIVGGAVAGAMLAANLKGSGLDVVVLETQPEIPPLKRGDLLSPSTVKELARLGILDKFLSRGAVQLHRWVALGPERETLADVPLAATAPAPYNYCIALPHPLLQEALVEAAMEADNVRFLRGLRATGLIQNPDGAAVGVRAAGRDGPIEVHARLVAGCDGSSSIVRQHAGIETEIETYPYSYLMLTCERSPDQPADQQTEIWGSEGFCGMFPITPEHVRCPVQAGPGELARWRSIGLPAIHDELKARFPFFESMRLMEEVFYSYKILTHHARSYVADGVILLGDAVHITPPYYGMGMNMSMRDAHHASALIIPLLRAGDTPSAAALKPYERQVRNFNEYVLTASRLYGKVAAAHIRTHAEVEAALEHSLALDPGAMSIIYGDYDAPPPSDAQIAALRRGQVAAA